MSFHILDYFDDNIDNLDITKNYIYVLQLIEERYYVGRTTNILNRIEQHFTGYGSIYTTKYKPLKVIEVKEELTREDERTKTIEIMNKYGWEKVRGAGWCSLEINKPDFSKKYIKEVLDNFEPMEIDSEIINLYCNEHKNIIEIGDIINKTPTWISYRLTKLKIIDRIQLSRGFFEYYKSDKYKLSITNYNDKIEIKKKEKLKAKKDQMKNSMVEMISDKIYNKGKKWEKEEEQTLLDELSKNMDIELIAVQHGRTVEGINSRRREISYKLYNLKFSIEEIINKTKLTRDEILKTIKKRDLASNIKNTNNIKQPVNNYSELKAEMSEMRNEISELKKTIKELVGMMNAVYEFEDA